MQLSLDDHLNLNMDIQKNRHIQESLERCRVYEWTTVK
jgi:hypothetical protein